MNLKSLGIVLLMGLLFFGSISAGLAKVDYTVSVKHKGRKTAQTALTWTNLVNCAVTNNTLRKVSGCNGCPNATASSVESISTGDGSLSITADNTKTDRYCGLTSHTGISGASSIDFAFHLSSIGDLEVREGGVYRTDVPYATGDVLQVAIVSGVVKYSKNGTVVYKSRLTPTYPLSAGACLLTTGATVANAVGNFASAAIAAPQINSVDTTSVSSSQASIAWTTTTPCNSRVQYGLTASYGTTSDFGDSMTTAHSGTIGGLLPATTYHYRVTSQDLSGNSATSGDYIFQTTAAAATASPFTVQNPYCSVLTSTGAVIMWTTSQPSDSQVLYGPTASYGSSTPVDPSVSLYHSVFIAGLNPGTTYNYQAVCKDPLGNVAISINSTFTTPASQPGVPALPRVSLDTTMPSSNGAVRTVNQGDNLQTVLNQAQPGDTIVLQAGATFVAPAGGFVLPPKNNPNSLWIIIRTSNLTSLPPEGVMVQPSDAASMPKILSPNSGAALYTQTGSGAASVAFWRLIGIEVSVTSTALPDANTAGGAAGNTGLVRLGDPYESNAQNVPHDFVIDRCYIHGLPNVNTIRGINLNSGAASIIDSYLSEFHGVTWESQAIGGWNGPGPYKIVGNFVEGASENFMFGGADPKIQNLVPSDIEIRQNHFYKPLSWQVSNSTYAGYHWSVKNLMELKNSARVLIAGNLFENSWADAQIGYGISIKSSNQDGTAPWSGTSDVTFVSNTVHNAAIGIQVAARDNTNTVQITSRVKVAENVFEDINSADSGGAGTLVRIIGNNAPVGMASSGPQYVTVDHNTGFVPSNNNGKMLEVDDVSPGFIFTNNMFDHSSYAVKGDGTADGDGTITKYFPGSTFVANVIVGNALAGSSFSAHPGNFFAASWAAVQMVSVTSADYQLLSSSPYKDAATDGTDIGANMDELETAQAQVTSVRAQHSSVKKVH